MDAYLILDCLHTVRGSDRLNDSHCPECDIRGVVVSKVYPQYTMRCTECRYARKRMVKAEANRLANAHWRRTHHEVAVTDDFAEYAVTEL